MAHPPLKILMQIKEYLTNETLKKYVIMGSNHAIRKEIVPAPVLPGLVATAHSK